MKTKAILSLVGLSLLGITGAMAQSEPTPAAEYFQSRCKVLNAEDLKESATLGHLSLPETKSVKIQTNSVTNEVLVSVQLEGGSFSIAPSANGKKKPRLYVGEISQTMNTLKNIDEDESDVFKISQDLKVGQLVVDGIIINLACNY